MTDLADFFDRAYVINLDRRTDRWKKAMEELSKVGLADRAVRVPGVEHRTPNAGCTFAHLRSLKQSLADGARCPVFFEDDARFFDNWKPVFAEAVEVLPADWDFFYLGYNLHPNEKKMVPDFAGSHLLRLHGCLTAHALSLSKKAVEEAIARIEKLERTVPETRLPPPDIVYRSLWGLKKYGVYPMIVDQTPGFSDIRGHHVKYALRQNVDEVLLKNGRSWTLRK